MLNSDNREPQLWQNPAPQKSPILAPPGEEEFSLQMEMCAILRAQLPWF